MGSLSVPDVVCHLKTQLLGGELKDLAQQFGIRWSWIRFPTFPPAHRLGGQGQIVLTVVLADFDHGLSQILQ
ncbi:MAG: hypothetical protein ACT4OM_08520 [Actinomycetota bacterium]